MENSEGDKERRSHVYRIVEVGHKHDGAEADGGDDENVAQGAAFPKYQSH